MQSKDANALTDKIVKTIESKNFDIAVLPEMLMQLREYSLKEEDPMVTRILRHMSEYLSANADFPFTAMTDEDEEGELFLLEPEDDKANLLYILELIRANRNETNRKELWLMGEELKAAL
jgi:hypothetical protein